VNTASPSPPTDRQATFRPLTSPGSQTIHSGSMSQAYSSRQWPSTASASDGQGWP
jgi:hypothetical protein